MKLAAAWLNMHLSKLLLALCPCSQIDDICRAQASCESLQPLNSTVPQTHKLTLQSLSAEVTAEPESLARFITLCQPHLSKRALPPSSAPTEVPLMYFAVQTFRLQLAALANVHYPLSALGTVMSSYRAVQLKPHDSSGTLKLR